MTLVPLSDGKLLKQNLNNLKITKIDYLILTHTHYDHAENASRLKKEFGAVVIVNNREAEYLQKGKNTIPQGTNFITRFLVKRLGPVFSEKMNYEPCEPDITGRSVF